VSAVILRFPIERRTGRPSPPEPPWLAVARELGAERVAELLAATLNAAGRRLITPGVVQLWIDGHARPPEVWRHEIAAMSGDRRAAGLRVLP
jgi:hypothetical protein